MAPGQDTRFEAPHGGNPPAPWGVTGLIDKAIVPQDAEHRRMRGRMRALRAADRLGLLGEENLIPTLARRPRLRWLADEGGARWAVLAELGRLSDPGAFDEAVEWVLERRPRPEAVRAYVRRLKDGAVVQAGKEGVNIRSIEERATSGAPLRPATAKEEERRC
jgi:hypothetical protein